MTDHADHADKHRDEQVFGDECDKSRHALEEYTDLKTTWVTHA
jgi:hypothetical protein